LVSTRPPPPGLALTTPLFRSNIKTLVLDEADEMLNKGFKEQIYDIYRYLPPETQVGRAVACVRVLGRMCFPVPALGSR
jgi:hypothetical protein